MVFHSMATLRRRAAFTAEVKFMDGHTCQLNKIITDSDGVATRLFVETTLATIIIGKNLKGTIAGMETWRGKSTVTIRICHPQCNGDNWCTNESATGCIPALQSIEKTIYDPATAIYKLTMSRKLILIEASTAPDCHLFDVTGTSTSPLGLGAECTYDISTRELSVKLGTDLKGDQKFCINEEKLDQSVVDTEEDADALCFKIPVIINSPSNNSVITATQEIVFNSIVNLPAGCTFSYETGEANNYTFPPPDGSTPYRVTIPSNALSWGKYIFTGRILCGNSEYYSESVIVEVIELGMNISSSSWRVHSGSPIVISITSSMEGAPYSVSYISLNAPVYALPPLDSGNVLNIPKNKLSPGVYLFTVSLEGVRGMLLTHSKNLTVNSNITKVEELATKFVLTMNSPFREISSSNCSYWLTPRSISKIGNESRCINNPSDSKKVIIYAKEVEKDVDLELLSPYILNSEFRKTADNPSITEVAFASAATLSGGIRDKHWDMDKQQILALTVPALAVPADSLLWDNIQYDFIFAHTMADIPITITSHTPFLTLPPNYTVTNNYTLDAGTYSLSVKGKLLSNLVEGGITEEFPFTYVGDASAIQNIMIYHKPNVILTGLNASYTIQDNITLSGSASSDLDNPSINFAYKWECFTDSAMQNTCTGWKDKTTAGIILPLASLSIGTYTIRLSATKLDVYTSTSSGVITVTAMPTPNINLEIKQEPIHPEMPSIFEAVITSGDKSPSTVNISYRDYTIKWTISPEIIKTSYSQNHNILNIAKGALQPGEDYVIKCEVTQKKDAALNAEAEISVNVPGSIKIGTLDISPDVGKAFHTDFFLNANNWEDPSGRELEYKFEYKMFGANTSYLPKVDRSKENTARVHFPPGLDLHNNRIEVIVRVASSTGATANLVQTITVNPIIIEDKEKFVEDNLEQATTSGEVIQAVGETTFLLIEKPDAVLEEDVCGGCETKHGKCNIESKLCECHLEYSLHKYCKVKNTRITEMISLSNILATGKFTNYKYYIYIYI